MLRLHDYADIIGEKEVNAMYEYAAPLAEKHVVHVNSTYYGGGVAEMLNSLVPLYNDLGMKAGWRLIKGNPDFFSVTKSFHNALQGSPIQVTDMKKKIFEEVSETNALISHLRYHDCVIIHDPQPLPIIRFMKKTQPWLWRCHIDISDPDKELWAYLKGFIARYDQAIISKKSFDHNIPIPKSIIAPAIDPLSTKNRELGDETVMKTLQKFGIEKDKPIISQISRFDKWKDPLGVIQAFKIARQQVNCKLVLLGSMATDDPEGQAVYDEIKEAAKDEPDIIVINFENDTLVNAVQTASDIIIQKSLKEGFGLTVSEALWKKTPVIAGNVGGIPLQVKQGKDGYLVNSVQECAKAIVSLLNDPKKRKEMGEHGHAWVKEHFLITRQLHQHIGLLRKVMITYKV